MIVTDEGLLDDLSFQQRMALYDALPLRYRNMAKEHGLGFALREKIDDDEIAAFEADHAR